MKKSLKPRKATPPAKAEDLEPKDSGLLPLPDEESNQPLWAPHGVDLKVVPKEVQRAVAEVVQPVYERFVLQADDPLERSVGVTIAHLLWLEVLQQFDVKQEYTRITAVLGLAQDRGAMIEQHLRILQSKIKVGYFLARICDLRRSTAFQPVTGEQDQNVRGTIPAREPVATDPSQNSPGRSTECGE